MWCDPPWYKDPTEPEPHISRVEDGYEECDFQDLLDKAVDSVFLSRTEDMRFLADVYDLWEKEGGKMEWDVDMNNRLFAIIEKTNRP